MASTQSTTSSSTGGTTRGGSSAPGGSAKAAYEIYHPSGPLPPSKPNHEFTRKPSGTLARYVWKWRMWFEATFVLSMLEPWEKIMLVTIFLVVSFFFTSAIIKYLPKHLTIMKRRATYYLIGQEGDERLLWQWISGLLPIVANAPAASEAASTARRLSTNSEL